jgi:hypothetical protein
MRIKDFYPPVFFDTLSEESSSKEIASKVKCNESIAEHNLRLLVDEDKLEKIWKYGMWRYRRKVRGLE